MTFASSSSYGGFIRNAGVRHLFFARSKALHAPLPATAVSGGPKVVSLHAVCIARYSQRSRIVRTSEHYRVVQRGTDWWAEPLDAMLTRVLAENRTERASSFPAGDS